MYVNAICFICSEIRNQVDMFILQ